MKPSFSAIYRHVAKLAHRHHPRRKSPPRPQLEALESRIAPAMFTASGTALAIKLENPNETISLATSAATGAEIFVTLTNGTIDAGSTGIGGVGSANGSITSGSFTSITITDSNSGNAVHFTDSANTAYPQAFTINLSHAGSGDVTFAGTSSFAQTLNVTTVAGSVTSDAASHLLLTGAANLAITDTGHDVLLQGAVAVAGTTSIAGNLIVANNAANSFGGAVQLTGPAEATVFNNGSLTLAASSFALAGLNQTSLISAAGDITQTGAISSTGGGTLEFSSTGGGIALSSTSNNVSSAAALSFSATGTHAVTFYNANVTQLGNVTLGSGPFSLTSTGSVSQKTGTGITTAGSVMASIDTTANRNLILNSAANHITGPVTFGESTGGTVQDISLRNAADNASAPTGTPLTTAGDVRNLTLFFDHTGVALPAYNITGALNVTAGGDLTQTAALTVKGVTTAALLGDFQIALTNPANALTGPVDFNAPQSTHAEAVVNGAALLLGPSNVGRGQYSATALLGDLTQSGGLVEEPGAGVATFTVTAGTTITLGNAGNQFTGAVSYVGAALATATLRNADDQAQFSQLAIPAGVTALTLRLDNAPALLPSETIANLTVTAQGIAQQSGTGLTISGNGSFNANGFPLTLSGSNHFSGLTIDNSGRNDVTVNSVDSADLTFAGASALGSGRLTITAEGNIAESGTISQAAGDTAGAVSFDSAAGAISLGGANTFRGPFSASVSLGNSVTVNSQNAPLILGHVTTASGLLTATGDGNGIVQDPNSILTLGGSSSFTAPGGSITLTDHANTFAGAVGFTGTNASVFAAGPIAIGTSNVTGALSVTTRGLGTDLIAQAGDLTGGGDLTLHSGAANITLTDANNDFGTLSLSSTGSTVSVTNGAALPIGAIRVGGGSLTLVSGGDLGILPGATIVQTTGAGAATLTTPAGHNISLASAPSQFLGQVTVTHSTDVGLDTTGDLTFNPSSAITGFLNVISNRIVTLSGNLTHLTGLSVSAYYISLGSNVTAGAQGIFLGGGVALNAGLTLTSGADIVFSGDVIPFGALTLDVAGGQVAFTQGYWIQGSNPLTINGAKAGFAVGDDSGPTATFTIDSGTISMPGGGDFTVSRDGLLTVGGAAAPPQTVTLNNGSGSLIINGGLGVGFGATSDQLFKTGNGLISLGASAQLNGNRLAGASPSPVLVSQAGQLTGHFVNSVDASGHPHDFLAGSDIVRPTYTITQLSVQTGGSVAANGTATGFLPDGAQYTVTTSLGAAAGLATVTQGSGHLAIVVREDAPAAAAKLSITTTGGGDGLLPIDGVAAHFFGTLSIVAPAANFIGSIATDGALTALTAHDLAGISTLLPFQLTDEGLPTVATSITAHVVQNARIMVSGTLGTFKAVSVPGNVQIFAEKFGSITTTGDVAGSGASAAPDPGAFAADLTSNGTTTGTILSSAKIAGLLSGTWYLPGNVGSITAAQTANWTLEVDGPASATVPNGSTTNGGLLGNVTALTLGPVTSSAVYVSGAVAALTTSDITDGIFYVGTFGTVKVAPNPALGLTGLVTDTTFTASGHAAGVAIKSLTTAGDFAASSITLLDGDATAIVIGRTVTQSHFTGTDTGVRGNFKSLTAGAWASSDLQARSVGSLRIVGNLGAGLFGTFASSTVTLSANTAGVALGTFSTQSDVSLSTFDLQSGNLTSFLVGGQLSSTTVQLTDPALSALGAIQAADWASGDSVMARTIGTVASVGAKATALHSTPLPGGMEMDSIYAYLGSGGTAAIAKISTAGDLADSSILAPHGIGSLTVGHIASNSTFLADDAAPGAANVGRIATLTAGAWSQSTVSANTLGLVKITGAAEPENATQSALAGDISSGTFLAHGATPTAPVGIGSFSVAANVSSTSTIHAPFGIGALTVGADLSSTLIDTENAGSPSAGFITSLTAGQIESASIRAGSIGTLKVAGYIPLGLLGSVTGSIIALDSAAATPTGPQALGSLTVNGDFTDSLLNAPASVGAIKVLGRIAAVTTATWVEAGYAAAAHLGSLTTGAWGEAGPAVTTSLVTQTVSTFALTRNSHRGFAGTSDGAFLDILGASGTGVGLGAYTASGAVTNSLLRVNNGDVTSVTVERFISSDLLVGFTFPKADDLTATPTSAQWSATNHQIGSFKTTGSFSPADPADSAAFQDSNVIAARLGNITLSGVNPTDASATAYGVAFRATGGAAGTVKIDGSATGLLAPAVTGQFHYLGLAG